MRWKFWTGKQDIKKQVRRSIRSLRWKISEQIQDVHKEIEGTAEGVKEKIDILKERFDRLTEDFTDFAQKLQQLRRLQYKNDQEIKKKLDNLMERLDESTRIEKQYEELQKEQQYTENKLQTLIDLLIERVDEIDRVLRGLDSEENNWKTLLEQWTEKVLKKLSEVDIYELILEDEIFDSRFAEAMETVGPEELKEGQKEYKQYQIVEVITRAFVHKNGDIIRKARVITYKEEKEDEGR